MSSVQSSKAWLNVEKTTVTLIAISELPSWLHCDRYIGRQKNYEYSICDIANENDKFERDWCIKW